MSITDLPLELTNKVIDSLDGHVPSLTNCALTCRAWTPRCNAWLHNRVALPVDEPDTMDFILEYYRTSPNRECVHRALIRMAKTVQNGLHVERLIPIIRQIFELFPNLRDIALFLPPEELRSMLPILNSIKVKTASIGSRCEPPYAILEVVVPMSPLKFDSSPLFFSLLQSIPRLSHIVIAGQIQFSPEFDWFSRKTPSSMAVLPMLREFQLHTLGNTSSRDQLLLWLCSDRDGTTLTNFGFSGKCTTAVNEALATLGGSLEQFSYDEYPKGERACVVDIFLCLVDVDSVVSPRLGRAAGPQAMSLAANATPWPPVKYRLDHLVSSRSFFSPPPARNHVSCGLLCGRFRSAALGPH